jgi:hypothetical protein
MSVDTEGSELQVLQFAKDTKDVFFVPSPAMSSRTNDYRRFESARKECRMFQRCAV